MGCERLKHLHQGENAKYTGQRIIQEFLKVMADQLEQQMFCSLQSSMFFKNKRFIIGSEATRSNLVSCPDHTSHEENGLVNQVEFVGLEAH